MWHRLFRRKSLDALSSEVEAPSGLARTLGAVDLVALGIGAIVGAGIFATVGTAATGDAARLGAGPAIMLSFLLTGAVCAVTALCYAELAAMIPVSGSAYTYAFATLGELVAWIIGWDLLIEYAAGNVAVAISWAEYLQAFLKTTIGTGFPPWLITGYRAAPPEVIAAAPSLAGIPILINLPAILIVLAVTWVLVIGVKESARFNSVMVAIKLVILLFFVVVGVGYFDLANWFPPEAPTKWQGFAPNGMPGIAAGAAVVFFAYIGFDAVSTAGEETKNPKRDLPIGILGSLVVCTIVYMVVAAVLTGMISYTKLNSADPLAVALTDKGLTFATALVSFGALVATTAVLLVFQMGQPRIFYSMARDGLLPKWFAKVHPKYRTPAVTTIWTGVVVAALSGFFSIGEIVDLTNIGTLFAFALVCGGVLVLRVIEPERPRPFRTPLVWVVAPLGMASCVYLMAYLPAVTWVRFGVWLLIGLIVYLTTVVWRDAMVAAGQPTGRASLITTAVGGGLTVAVVAGSITLGLWH
jgi:APA family basic amino acid/polyamine antiporter